MDSSRLVSVIIPVYNSERYLDDCLSSICVQTYHDIEIVVVNDGSTDSSRNILTKWQNKDRRIVVYDRENRGQSAARNFGLEKCHGDSIMFVDSDDVLYSQAIEELFHIKSAENVRIVCGLICSNLKKLGRNRKERRTIYSGELLAEKILYQTASVVVGPWAQMFDKSVFDAGNRFIEGMYYEDLELIPRIYAFESRIAVLNTNIYYYRQHESSFVHQFSTKRFDSLKATASLLEHVAPISEKLRKAVNDRILSASFNVMLLAANRAEFKEFAEKAWENIKEYRWSSLINSKVRLKNKAGVLVSFLGKKIFKKNKR